MTAPAPSFDLFQLVRELGSSFAILLGIAYLSGFMVYHTYLGNAGVVPLGLLNVQYLVAGMLFLVAGAVVWVPAWIGDMMAVSGQAGLKRQGEPETRVSWSSLAIRAIGTVSGWFVGGLALYAIGVKVGDVLWWWIPSTYAPHLFLRSRYWHAARLEGTGRSPNERFALYAFPLLVVVRVVLSGTFGTRIYPQIDRAVGGGRPVRLRLEVTTVREPTSGCLGRDRRTMDFSRHAATSYYIVSSDQVKVATLRGDALLADPNHVPRKPLVVDTVRFRVGP